MFRDKLYFLIKSSIRSNKRDKVFKNSKKYEDLSQNATTVRKRLIEKLSFEIPLSTKAALIGLVFPFLGAFVYIGSWCKSLTNYYNKYHEIIHMSAFTSLTFYVGSFYGKSLISIGYELPNSHNIISFVKKRRCYFSMALFLLLNCSSRIYESKMLKEYNFLPNIISFSLIFLIFKNVTVSGFLPAALYKNIGNSVNILLMFITLINIEVFNERKKEIRFFSHFRGRIEKLQESNMINLKNRIYS